VINFWIGKADGTPLFVMARAAPQVKHVTVMLASGSRRELSMSPVIEDFGLRFAAGRLPDDDLPVSLEVAVDGGETQVHDCDGHRAASDRLCGGLEGSSS